MTPPECPREQDVIMAIVTGHWPHQCDETLTRHASECRVCKELVEVASVLRLERDGLHEEMSIPSAGQVWWRAAMRARLEASQQVARPLSWLFGVSVACAVGLTVTVVELLWSPVQRALSSAPPGGWTLSLGLGELVRLLPNLSDLAPLTTTGAFLLLGVTACLVLAPLALYFALSDE
jgi:hypothetical protein